jgi:Tfp pilus assembly protein PilN
MKLIPQTSVGIEIAGKDLRIAVVREFAGRRRLVRLDVLTGFVGLTEEDSATYLAAHFKKHKLTNYNVHLTFPGAWGVTRDLEFPVAVGTGEALRSAVALQVENMSPWTLDEIYWDCAFETPAKGVRTIIVHVGIMPRAVLDPWIGMFRSARLALAGVSLSSLSWAHGVTVLWGKDKPAMVLAAEEGYVEGSLIRSDHIYTVSLPGADHAQLAPVSASQLMRASRIESPDDLRFVTHGAFSGEAGLESIRLPIEGSTSDAPNFGAISTALLGLIRTGFHLNLVPPQQRYQRNVLQIAPTYALTGLLILLGVFAWIREPYQQSLYAEQLEEEAQRVALEVRPLADQETRLNEVTEKLKSLDGALRTRDSNLEALREISRVLPEGTFLTSYACQDHAVTISGLSDSAASIQRLLENSPTFRDVQFASSITRDATGKDRFVLKATIEAQR